LGFKKQVSNLVANTERLIRYFKKGSDDLGFEKQVSNLVANTEHLKTLLTLEKQRRNVPVDTLVFAGASIIADYYWCAWQSKYKSRRGELNYFATYLENRLNYSNLLGYSSRIPKNDEALLTVGDNITFDDIKQLLQHNSQLAVVDKPKDEESGMSIVLSESSPSIRGAILHEELAEKHPTISWHFTWDKYVILTVPDGITDEYIYEFKTIKSKNYISFSKPIANAQAEIYALQWNRPKKRIQYYIMQDETFQTTESQTDRAIAEKLFCLFRELHQNPKPVIPLPVAFKCKSCSFAEFCEGRKQTQLPLL
jgi:CRISPR/Cas system-associated exonuclease Cas4 (RecB family)